MYEINFWFKDKMVDWVYIIRYVFRYVNKMGVVGRLEIRKVFKKKY